MKKSVLAVVLVAAPLLGAEPAGVVVWPASELKGYRDKLAPRINERKFARENLATFGNHSAMIAHRQGDGEAEVHETQADVFFVTSGAATLVVGGEVPGAKTTSPGEIRGPSIKGGEHKALSAGDIVHIPAKVPHQLLVAPGKEFTYFVFKIDTP